jgi:polyhydroxyalkanoate synthesis regulator phasin
MAKEKKGGKDRKDEKADASRTDQVRSAVDQAFQAAGSQLSRERAQEIADDLSAAAQRVRETLEELRPPSTDELRDLQDRLAALERRVAALEKPAPKPRRPPATRKPAQRKPTARKPAGGAAS